MKRLGILSAALLALSFVGTARADDRKEIETLYGKLSQALLQNKPEAILQLGVCTLTLRTPDGGTVSGEQFIAHMKQKPFGTVLKTMDIKLENVAIKDKTANRCKTASVLATFTARSQMVDAAGEIGKEGATHVLEMKGSIRNRLGKMPRGWNFSTMEYVIGAVTLDGKPFDPSKMGGPPKK